MILVKILKRKDASSVIVAIVLAMIVGQFLAFVTQEISSIIAGTQPPESSFGGPNWQTFYLQPFVALVLQIISLEILAWIVVLGGKALQQPVKKK